MAPVIKPAEADINQKLNQIEQQDLEAEDFELIDNVNKNDDNIDSATTTKRQLKNPFRYQRESNQADSGSAVAVASGTNLGANKGAIKKNNDGSFDSGNIATAAKPQNASTSPYAPPPNANFDTSSFTPSDTTNISTDRKTARAYSDRNTEIYQRHYGALLSFNGYLQNKFNLSVLEAFLLALYFAIVVTGQIVYWLNRYFLTNSDSFLEQNDSDVMIYDNYFTQKRNFINQLFVKRGWGWTTVVLGFVVVKYVILRVSNGSTTITTATTATTATASTASTTVDNKEKDGKEKAKFSVEKQVLFILARFGAATTWWIFFTQWFFGHPLMDRIFIATGGKCTGIQDGDRLTRYITKNPLLKKFLKQVEEKTGSYLMPGPMVPEGMLSDGNDNDNLKYEAQISSMVCRKIGGRWTGGHDPSGHCFLLIHSSLFLLFEVLPLVPVLLKDLFENNVLFHKLVKKSQTAQLALEKISYRKIGNKAGDNISAAPVPEAKESQLQSFSKLILHPLVLVSLLVGLWSWMLLITTMYFHSLRELLAGAIAGYVEIVLVYVLPKFL